MHQPSGWLFSVEDRDVARRFVVAEPFMIHAKTLIARRLPTAKIVNHQQLPAALFAFLEMNRGDISEWPAK